MKKILTAACAALVLTSCAGHSDADKEQISQGREQAKEMLEATRQPRPQKQETTPQIQPKQQEAQPDTIS